MMINTFLLLPFLLLTACVYPWTVYAQVREAPPMQQPAPAPAVQVPASIQPIMINVDGKTWTVALDSETYANLAKKAGQIRQSTVGDLLALAISTTIRQLATDPNVVTGHLADLHSASQSAEAAEVAARAAAVTIATPAPEPKSSLTSPRMPAK